MMKKALPLVLFSGLILASCTLTPSSEVEQSAQIAAQPVQTAKGNLAEQLAEPTPRPEPKFRAALDIQADTTGLDIGEEATVLIYANDLKQPITTISSTLQASEHLKILSLTVNKEAFPMEFKKDVSADGRSASLAVSNGKGVEGEGVTVATLIVQGVSEGPGTITFNSDETSLLLSDNTEVAPKSSDLPKIEITVVK